jgi:hypothetical protein
LLEQAPLAHAQAAAAAAHAQSAAAADAAPLPPTQDPGWPRQINRNDATIVYYQPQVDEWKDYKLLRCRIAFTLAPPGGAPVPGVASLTADTLVDRDTRTVFLRDIEVKSVRFPGADAAAAHNLELWFRGMVPSGGEPISVDRLMAAIERDRVTARTVAVKNDPPRIFYSTSPALLLLVDGEAIFAPVGKTNLEFVVNTNWDLFRDKSSKEFFLLTPAGWLGAKDLDGPWNVVKTLPDDFKKLPSDENFDAVRKAVPAPNSGGAAPRVFYSNSPAELVLLRGAPVYQTVPGTQLVYVANTDGDVFFDQQSRQFFVLLSGRWFRAPTLDGPFEYASDRLPADFLKIPQGSPKLAVRAAVPGTQEAADAVMLAQIPTTAVIDKKEAEASAKVAYDGQPQFATVEGTTLKYATNTDAKVLKVGDLYYLCFQGVWFVSSTPNGPWKTADSVPTAIYGIPPSSPVYNVTYVTQTNATPTTVESSYSAGYFGTFVVGMTVGLCIAYGTGWRYPPYVYRPPGMMYPIYRPWPVTYGAAAVYNPRTGGYAVGRAAYGPYGAAGTSAWYNPATGRYGRSASVQGYGGGRSVASSYNPWTGNYTRTEQGHNAYSQWGNSVTTRGSEWARTGHVTTAGGTTAAYRTSTGKEGVVRRNENGTVARTDNGVYAGKDGNVYKRDSKGDWSKYDNGGWNKVDRSAAQSQGLVSSAEGRDRGQRQVQQQRPATTTNTRETRPAGQERRPAAQTPSRGAAGGGRRGGGRR